MVCHLTLSKKIRIRLIGIILFYTTLIFNLGFIIILILKWNLAGLYNLAIIFLTFFLCALPAALSSFVASYLSHDRREGLRTVFISGLIIGIVHAILFFIYLLYLLTIPPRDLYESAPRAAILILFELIFTFIFFPIAGISLIFAIIFANLGYQVVKYQRGQFFIIKNV